MSGKEPITFNLTQPVKLSKEGKFEDQYELYLYSPSKNDRKLTRKIRQLFIHVLTDMQNNFTDSDKSSKEKTELNGESLIQAIYVSSQDLNEFFDMFKLLATNGAVRFINDVKINSLTYDEICEEDEERLLGEYLANFILTSLMKQLNAS